MCSTLSKPIASQETVMKNPMNKSWRATVQRIVITAVGVGAFSAVSIDAQWLNQPTVGIPRKADGKPNLAAPTPRTADGHPDFSGLWTKVSPKYARNIAADLKASDIQPWARALVDKRAENLQEDYMNALCEPLAPVT